MLVEEMYKGCPSGNFQDSFGIKQLYANIQQVKRFKFSFASKSVVNAS